MGVMSSSPAIRLAEVPDEVRALTTQGLFYGASGVLTSVVIYHPNLDFATICSGYADGLSTEDIQTLGGELAAARKVGGRASLYAVGDGCSP